MSIDESWEIGRPVFNRLPAKGYKDNLAVDSLTQWQDQKLTAKADQLQNFYKNLDPDTAPIAYLDYLAYLVGLSGSYWDSNWDPEIKRQFIRIAHPYLWPMRGTMAAIKKVLDTHQLAYSIWEDGESVLPFKMPKAFGSAKLRFYIRLGIQYRRNGQTFTEARRTISNFAPAVTKTGVVYERFYISFSKLGEPMFSK